MKNSFQTLLLGAGFGAAFLIGQCFPRTGNGATAAPRRDRSDLQLQEAQGSQVLDAQGRGPVNAPPAPPSIPADEQAGAGSQLQDPVHQGPRGAVDGRRLAQPG